MVNQLPRQLGASYELVELIARGGMGEVYLARDLRNAGRHVVVKSLQTTATREAVGMFLGEARVATLLTHPNIVRVYEADYIDGRFVLVMEWLRGCDLHELSRRAGLLPITITLRLIRDACRGLQAAHDAATEDGRALYLVHRDINPPNLFVTAEGVLKILDFGMSKSSVHLTRTRTGLVKGKWGYLSPEQCRGAALDRRSDIFSLGIVLHELLTGQRLFAASNASAAMQAISNDFIPPPGRPGEALSEELVAVTMRALHRDPSLRYPNAESFGAALDALGGIEDSSRVASHLAHHLGVAPMRPETIASWASDITEHLELVSGSHVTVVRKAWRYSLTAAVCFAFAVAVAVLATRQSTPPRPSVPPPEIVSLPAVAPSPPLSAPTARAEPPPKPPAPAPPRAPPAPRPPRVERATPAADGRITLDARPSADVYVAGRFVGTTPLIGYVLPAGDAKLRLVNTDLGVDRVINLRVPAGGEVRKVVQLNEP